MDRIGTNRSHAAQALPQDARKNRAVVLLICAVVFWQVAVTCMVVAKAMAPAPHAEAKTER